MKRTESQTLDVHTAEHLDAYGMRYIRRQGS